MDLQLNGKTALATGASMGIGSSVAKILAAEGVKCSIAARRLNLLEQVAQELSATGAPAPACIAVDVLLDDAPRRLADEAIPMGRYGEPEELSVLAAFLASPLAGYITGTVLPVDGGLRRYAF